MRPLTLTYNQLRLVEMVGFGGVSDQNVDPSDRAALRRLVKRGVVRYARNNGSPSWELDFIGADLLAYAVAKQLSLGNV